MTVTAILFVLTCAALFWLIVWSNGQKNEAELKSLEDLVFYRIPREGV